MLSNCAILSASRAGTSRSVVAVGPGKDVVAWAAARQVVAAAPVDGVTAAEPEDRIPCLGTDQDVGAVVAVDDVEALGMQVGGADGARRGRGTAR
jgi:hypothetical protein